MTKLRLIRTNLLCHKCKQPTMAVYDLNLSEEGEKEDGISGGIFQCSSCNFNESYNDKEATILFQALEKDTEEWTREKKEKE